MNTAAGAVKIKRQLHLKYQVIPHFLYSVIPLLGSDKYKKCILNYIKILNFNALNADSLCFSFVKKRRKPQSENKHKEILFIGFFGVGVY